jgi:hypothetical protein
MNTFTTTLSPTRITRYLCRTIAILGILHFVGLTLSCFTHSNAIIAAAKLVNLDRERNLPTLFNVCLFLFNAALLLSLHYSGKAGRDQPLAWPLLSGTFTFLALDEFGSIHEQLNQPLRNSFHLPGILHFAWVIPYGMMAGILAIIVLPTIVKLRPRLRKWFFLAAIVYVSGAIGGQLLTAITHTTVSETNFLYGCLVAFEEICEMSGLTIFSYGLLRLMEQQYGSLTLIRSMPSVVEYDPIGVSLDRQLGLTPSNSL